jgi:hypothetical protein
MYVEKSAEILGSFAAATELPDEAAVDFRFVIYNFANRTNAKYDTFTVVIKSNGMD